MIKKGEKYCCVKALEGFKVGFTYVVSAAGYVIGEDVGCNDTDDRELFLQHFRPVNSEDTTDLVNNPPHYKDGGIETADFINAKGLNWELGNAVKYISRAGKKDPAKEVEDLEKAIWYINRQIKHLKDGKQTAG